MHNHTLIDQNIDGFRGVSSFAWFYWKNDWTNFAFTLHNKTLPDLGIYNVTLIEPGGQ